MKSYQLGNPNIGTNNTITEKSNDDISIVGGNPKKDSDSIVAQKKFVKAKLSTINAFKPGFRKPPNGKKRINRGNSVSTLHEPASVIQMKTEVKSYMKKYQEMKKNWRSKSLYKKILDDLEIKDDKGAQNSIV